MSVEIEFGVTCPCDGEQATIAADPLPPEFITVGSAVVACPGGVATITVTTDADAPRGSHSVTLVVRGAGDSECSKGLTVKIVGPDIQFGTLSEEEEEAPGGLVALNDDDDDYPNCQPDLEQTQPLQHEVEHENDIKKLTLTVDGYESAGTVRLEHPEGQDKIKVYRRLSPGSDTLVRMASWPKVWSSGTFTNPTTLFVEGVELSDGPRDVELELWYEPPVGDSCVDKLKLTVDTLDADVDSDNTSGAYDFPPGRTDYEDQIEADPTHPGRLVPLNDDDDDGDGIFDWDDGSDRDGVEATDDDVNTQEDDFVKVVLQLPKAECAGSSIQFEFAWNEESQPAAVALWGRPGHEARPEENDRLKPGNVYFVDDLPYYDPDTRIIQLWVEGLASGMRTALRFTWAGAGPSAGAVVSDTVFVTVVERTRLRAPYTGSIHSLRAASMDLPHGEILNAAFPKAASTELPESQEIRVWVDTVLGEPWDRSVLRMYCGIDGSDSEIDLTDHTEYASACEVVPDSQEPWPWRFSFRAVATKTLAPRCFVVHVSYGDSCGADSRWDTYVLCVEPFTAEHLGIEDESQLFLAGVPLLDVSVGAASFTLRSGVPAGKIGQAYVRRTKHCSNVYRYRIVFPDGVEQTFLPHDDQFTLGDPVYAKSADSETPYGTPCSGHLLGFHVGGTGGDVYDPDGTHWYAPVRLAFPTPPPGHYAPGYEELAWIQYRRPLDLAPDNPACTQYIYDTTPLTPRSRVVKIQDGLGHWIQLGRDAGSAVVTSITTSDGRSWAIQSDDHGRVVGIVPGSGKGARYFAYGDPENEAVRDRITQVGLSPGDGENVGDILYGFVYGADGDLAEEWHFADGQLRRVAQHIRDEELRARRDYFGPGANDYRLTCLSYDGDLCSRLAGVTTYRNPGGQGAPCTTSYAYNASMKVNVIQTVTLPDQSTITYAYDRPGGIPYIELGLRRKATRTKGGSSLTTYDVDYEFLYDAAPPTLFYLPRIIARRDGRGAVSQVNYDYENGGQDENYDGLTGEFGNHLFTVTGPTITSGYSGTRIPETWYMYHPTKRVLEYVDTEYDTDVYRTVRFTYDSLLRRTSQIVDPGGENLTTRFLYCDAAPTQDRITVDADGYWTRTRFDDDGRVAVVEQFLNANAGSLAAPCADPAGPVYRTINTYDGRGYLAVRTVENKDQAGSFLVPEAIVTTFTRDRLGRLTQRTLDMEGTDQEGHVDYNWLGEVEKEYDTSGRGTRYTYDGRGLVATQTPLALNQTPDWDLTTTFDYDSMGRPTFTWPPTHPAGPHFEREYDNFGRLKHIRRHPGADGGNLVTTTYEYDNASNVTRTYVTEAGHGVLSDATAAYDEGGFNYESRQRLWPGEDSTEDLATQRMFDWAGNVIAEAMLGDETVADLVVETVFDSASRVEFVRGYANTTLLSETWLAQRDGRGNVIQQQDRLGASSWAVSNVQYDAVGRAVTITDPPDHDGLRHYRQMAYDSRGNLLRQSACAQNGNAALTTVFGYDNAGRPTRAAVLADPASAAGADQADPAVDRVADTEYDADGRPRYGKTYNNNVAVPIITETIYDAHGRVNRVIDPEGHYAAYGYAPDGRFHERTIYDGVGLRSVVVQSYDGHDRAIVLKAEGPPDLFTTFAYDGLGRTVVTVDPNGVYRGVAYDLVGRPTNVYEDWYGPLQRETCLAYNSLGQLVTQIAENRASDGTPLPEQVTTYRYDSLGRTLRVVYPDAPPADQANPATCTDCVRLTYDFAGRPLQRQDQRNTTDFTFDDRGQLHARTTGTARDTYHYDALGRIRQAARGTTADEEAVASTQRSYTGLGDLDCEVQTIHKGTPRTTDYDHDQAGNQTLLGYPDGDVLTYTPTALNQVDSILRAGSPLVQYGYQGWQLHTRTTTTDAPGGATTYKQSWGYDAHRRIDALTNTRDVGDGPETVADYRFTHDLNGNPTSQIVVTGLEGFVGDDRGFQVDRLNRLVGTAYYGSGEAESTT
ncbi:MAG: RHS repeat protein, partial [Phycisphaerae bacterium]|nr:RHS repeat protein [Phycisphaerae bacterium]